MEEIELNNKDNLKVTLNVIGLDCAHCSSEIEEKVSKMDSISDCNINFITKELKVTIKDDFEKNEEIEKIAKLIDIIEPGLKVKEKTEKSQNTDDNEEGTSNEKVKLARIALGIITFIIGLKTDLFIVYLISYLLFGYDIIIKAFKNLLKGKIFDENFLMSVATIGAFLIKEFPEAVAVMLFYQIGEYFQEKAVGKSRRAIQSLVNIKAEYATRENGEKVDPDEIALDEIIIVRAGEKVALDGIVVEGTSFLDMSALIGESVPRKVTIGEEVLSGSINNNSIIKVKVTKEYANSTVSKILDLMENASSRKSKSEKFISKFAKIYTPIVVFIALFLAIVPPFFTGYNFADWIRKSLVFLVSSCPCALVVSVPLSFFSGLGSGSKRGILIKGSMYMQNLSEVDTIVFDKTGTLTKGVFEISSIKTFGTTESELLKIACRLEKLSIHPVAKSIVDYYDKNNGEKLEDTIEDFEEISGFGLRGTFEGEQILVGNYKLLEKYNVAYEKADEYGTIVYVSKGDKYLGYIIVSDIIKEETKEIIKLLKSVGVKESIMLSGDRKEVADYVSKEIGLTKAYAELLPQDKVAYFEKITENKKNGKVAFVGDGINDAPVLAISDVGIAMGGVGSDAAIEASDVVIMNDDLNKIYESIVISKNTLKIVKINVTISILIKFIVLFLAVFGITSMWMAIFADVGVSLIAILNAMKKKI